MYSGKVYLVSRYSIEILLFYFPGFFTLQFGNSLEKVWRKRPKYCVRNMFEINNKNKRNVWNWLEVSNKDTRTACGICLKLLFKFVYSARKVVKVWDLFKVEHKCTQRSYWYCQFDWLVSHAIHTLFLLWSNTVFCAWDENTCSDSP